jgi:hypothetical protein
MAEREGFEYQSLHGDPRWKKPSEFGGEGGIRTLGGHEAHNGFRDRPIQPLWHLSGVSLAAHIITEKNNDKITTPRSSAVLDTRPAVCLYHSIYF